MGVKYSASESSQLMEAMSSNIQVANEVTDRLSQGCDHLIATLDSGELMGAAYTAGKGLFSEIIIPAIKKLQEAVDDIQTELNSYRAADAQVAEYGNLDLDQLKKTKELREQQLASVKKAIEAKESFLERVKSIATFNIVSHMQSLVILSSAESQIESQIKELEEKIEKLEFFVAQVSQYFSDSLEVLRLAIQGASQLSQVLVDSNGNYYVDGVDMSWVKKMKEQKIETYIPITKKEKFIQTIRQQYGFSRTESEILLNLYQKLEKEYGSKKANIEFFKIVASYSYGDKSYGAWQVVGGLYSPNGVNGINVGINYRMKSVLRKYGLKDDEIDTIQKAIQNQHNFTNLKKIQETDSEAELTQKLDAGASKAYGKDVRYADLDANQKSRIRELLSQFGGTTDYSHMAATISAHYTGNHFIENEDDLAGWQGDVAGTMGLPPSLGNDDYRSDLDAVNIYNKMKNGDSVVDVTNSYYDSVERTSGYRAYEFVQNIGEGDYTKGMNKLEETYKLYVSSNSSERSSNFEKFMNAIQHFQKDLDKPNPSIGE
ncbi:ATP-binding protein [Streptococcus sanguinis]|uniref:ATP-binding protein n=1 Tax=Streptococcus sanguinis TaxID=1305 RepID=UPI002284C419|nr:ATP-binding protein [Streptococcus sanguinis]MCY7017254.1 ATP-binding protein [Streptococcus sanguinis]